MAFVRALSAALCLLLSTTTAAAATQRDSKPLRDIPHIGLGTWIPERSKVSKYLFTFFSLGWGFYSIF